VFESSIFTPASSARPSTATPPLRSPHSKKAKILIVNSLFNSRCFLELSLKSLLQFLTPIPEVHFKGSELREGGLIVGQVIPIHPFIIFVLHGLLQSYPFAHILTVHPPHQVPEGRTEQLRAKEQLSIARFGEDDVLRSPSEGRAPHHQMVEHATQGLNIRDLLRSPLVDSFRSHVVRRSNIMLERLSSLEAITRALDVRPRKILRSAKIDNLYLVFIVEQDVLGLQVAVHDLVLVVNDRDSLEDVADVVFEQRLPNYPVKFRLLPQLPPLRAIHLQK
jgi:hypothetical protein